MFLSSISRARPLQTSRLSRSLTLSSPHHQQMLSLSLQNSNIYPWPTLDPTHVCLDLGICLMLDPTHAHSLLSFHGTGSGLGTNLGTKGVVSPVSILDIELIRCLYHMIRHAGHMVQSTPLFLSSVAERNICAMLTPAPQCRIQAEFLW